MRMAVMCGLRHTAESSSVALALRDDFCQYRAMISFRIIRSILPWVLLLGVLEGSTLAQTSTSANHSSFSSGGITSGPRMENNFPQGNSFANGGAMAKPSQGGMPASQAAPSYLRASPALNGPGSVNYCMARSSCAAAANNCSNDCRHSSVVNGVGTGNVRQLAATGSASDDCSASCQTTYASCTAEASQICQLSH